MATTATSPAQRLPVVSTRVRVADGRHTVARVEAVALGCPRRQVLAQGTEGVAGLDHGIGGAVQGAGHLAAHRRVAVPHLLRLEKRDGARRGVGVPGERRHDVTFGGAVGDGERPRWPETESGDVGSHLLPATAGPLRHIELLA